jgi:hypothetical protein
MQLNDVPEWLATALVAAALAALGFAGKQILEWIISLIAARRSRRARLVTLLSLLNGTAAVYSVQAELAARLFTALASRTPDVRRISGGYEAVFAAAFDGMEEEDRQLHAVIRGYTVNGLKPLNEAIRDWLQADTEFKLARARARFLPWRRQAYSDLATQLTALEPHLFMWLAKYAVWIPDIPEHALVYLADEEKHGVPFPRGIERTIERALGIPMTRDDELYSASAAEEERQVSEAETV